MKYKPHDYQKYAADFIINNPISAILLSMGLEKTVITLTAINSLINDSFDVQKAIIIAPLRVARDTWPEEIPEFATYMDKNTKNTARTAPVYRQFSCCDGKNIFDKDVSTKCDYMKFFKLVLISFNSALR